MKKLGIFISNYSQNGSDFILDIELNNGDNCRIILDGNNLERFYDKHWKGQNYNKDWNSFLENESEPFFNDFLNAYCNTYFI